MMTMTEQLLKRDGTVFDGTVVTNDKGKPGYMVVEPCHRCGGSGGWKGWPGFTCFRCGTKGMGVPGTGKEAPRFEPLYTADKLVKMNAAQAKRDAKKQAKQDAAAAEFNRKLAENTENFNTEYADLLSQLGSLVETKEIVADIVRKGREKGSITEPQKSVLVNAIASAKKLAEQQSASAHVGVIGEKVSAVVTVTNVASFDRTPFRSYSRDAVETVYIVTMTDDNGNVFVTKTPNFKEEKGETFTLTGIVKEHSEYRGVKQTVLKNAKRTEIPTGAAAGFKKITE